MYETKPLLLFPIGGFCVGTSFLVEHQTLAGLGYCFSASLPPMLAAGTMKSLEILKNNPELTMQLAQKCQLLHDHFDHFNGLRLYGDPISPIKHLRLVDAHKMPRSQQKSKLKMLVEKVSSTLNKTFLRTS